MATGRVKWFDATRGFGFLTQDGGAEDVFCHQAALVQDGCFKSLAEGQKVEFDVYEDAQGGHVAGRVRRIFDESGALVTVLCGDAVQVRVMSWGSPNLPAMAGRLRTFGEVRETELLVRLRAPPYEMTVFDDAVAVVKGTNDAAVARSLVTRWLGVRLPE
jgi:CspA family cold shock protein